MHKVSRLFAALLLIPLTVVPARDAYSQDKVSIETVARVLKLLEGSGYQYSKLTASAWSVSFRGEKKEKVDVLLLPDRDDLVILSVIADHAQLDGDSVALRALLKAN